jgi:hypothetical protein
VETKDWATRRLVIHSREKLSGRDEFSRYDVINFAEFVKIAKVKLGEKLI